MSHNSFQSPSHSAHGATKKMSINQLDRLSPDLDNVQANEIWMKLHVAIEKIFQKDTANLLFEELYRCGYYLVIYKRGELLYHGVCDTVSAHLNSLVEQVKRAPDSSLLSVLRSCWSEFTKQLIMIKQILLYMDRSYVATARKNPIQDECTIMFREIVVKNADVRDRMQRLLLEMVDDSRRGVNIDYELLRSVLIMLVDLGLNTTNVYFQEFETKYLHNTVQHYIRESENFLQTYGVKAYLTYVEQLLYEESSRAELYLHAFTVPRLKAMLEHTLIALHCVSLLENETEGFIALIEQEDSENLNRMYRLFSFYSSPIEKVKSGSSESGFLPPAVGESTAGSDQSSLSQLVKLPPLGLMREMLKQYILKRGRELLSNPALVNDRTQYISSLIHLRRYFASLIDKCFAGDRDFVRAQKDAFEIFLNTPGDNLPSEYLSYFTDEVLRSGCKTRSVTDLHVLLDESVHLFRYLENKEAFMYWYKLHLQKRLLAGKTDSEEVEKLMISKIKSECGINFTMKLEGMFVDLKMSSELMAEYNNHRRNQIVSGNQKLPIVDLDVTVLSASNWPTPDAPGCNLPPEVQAAADAFNEFYLRKHSGRGLIWNCEKGTSDIVYTPPQLSSYGPALANVAGKAPGPFPFYKLFVSTWQMCTLSLFNSCNSLSLDSLIQQLTPPTTSLPASNPASSNIGVASGKKGLNVDDLKRHLLSLSTNRVPLLFCFVRGRTDTPGFVFPPLGAITPSTSASTGTGAGAVAGTVEKDEEMNGSSVSAAPSTTASASASVSAVPVVPALHLARASLAVPPPGVSADSLMSSEEAAKLNPRQLYFVLNPFFQARSQNLRIPLLSVADVRALEALLTGEMAPRGPASEGTGGEDGGNEEVSKLDHHTKSVLESNIVRILKAKKVVSHNTLMDELRKSMKRLTPRESDVKAILESLLDREYAERSEEDPSVYVYCP